MKDKLSYSPNVLTLQGASGLSYHFHIYNIDEYSKVETDCILIFSKRVIDDNQHNSDQKAHILLLIYSVPEEVSVGSFIENIKPIDADFVSYRYTPNQSERSTIINDIKSTDYYAKQRAYLLSNHK